VDCYCSILALDFQCIFGFGIVTRRVVYHRHNSFLVVASIFFYVLNKLQFFFIVLKNLSAVFFSAVFFFCAVFYCCD
jgi:hypothetical protein